VPEGNSILQNDPVLVRAIPMIERQYPAAGGKSIIGLFARQKAAGWTSRIEGKFELQGSSEKAMAS
jgi:hypothetical protein